MRVVSIRKYFQLDRWPFDLYRFLGIICLCFRWRWNQFLVAFSTIIKRYVSFNFRCLRWLMGLLSRIHLRVYSCSFFPLSRIAWFSGIWDDFHAQAAQFSLLLFKFFREILDERFLAVLKLDWLLPLGLLTFLFILNMAEKRFARSNLIQVNLNVPSL
jgi:hypothetical protein